MNKRIVFHLVATVTLVIGLAMGICAMLSMVWHDPVWAVNSLLVSSVMTVIFAGGLLLLTRGDVNLSRRDGFGVVTFGWLFAAVFGALPYILSGVIPHPVAAIFETMSGFTTTGASVLPNADFQTLESIPKGILFWRALTHWFGGMGVLVLCVAILPFLGVGGMQIYRAEMPGPSKDRLTPRITTTAKLLWGVYALLTLAEVLLLKYVGKMNWFDSVCHSFATIATGGFSTRTESIGAFHSGAVNWIVIVFMFLSGINFALHYRALTGRPGCYFRNSEFRLYLALWAGGCLFLTASIWLAGCGDFLPCVQNAFFTGTSIFTTTGFVTADFDQWPNAARFLLVLMMVCGSSTGSTSGAIKLMRISIIFKKAMREIRLFMRPNAVFQIKSNGRAVDDDVVSHITAFFVMYISVLIFCAWLMTFFTLDTETAVSSVAATLGGVGPGLAAVGATQNFAAIPTAGQVILTVCMLLGRLELYTVLILFLPSFWKK